MNLKNKNNSKLSSGAVVYIGLGANRASPLGAPAQTLRGALPKLHGCGAAIRHISRFYRTQPIGDDFGGEFIGEFINVVAVCHVCCHPDALLARLKNLERIFGRKTITRSRPLDLDILDYQGQVIAHNPCLLPHPRMEGRRFVFAPLAEVAPRWVHPITGAPVRRLLTRATGRIAVFSLQHSRISRKNRRSTPKNRRHYGARHS